MDIALINPNGNSFELYHCAFCCFFAEIGFPFFKLSIRWRPSTSRAVPRCSLHFACSYAQVTLTGLPFQRRLHSNKPKFAEQPLAATRIDPDRSKATKVRCQSTSPCIPITC
jgi:hypothetical protein